MLLLPVPAFLTVAVYFLLHLSYFFPLPCPTCQFELKLSFYKIAGAHRENTPPAVHFAKALLKVALSMRWVNYRLQGFVYQELARINHVSD
ncbi:MAG: hypothetical protein A2Z83_06615 [Omnitrophica bacterium GWA2_52_8]|nr:MAG: hypothetical protein A2Z83_06615 [Omnitrophica bacterium GWA2_52_8]